MGATSLRAPRAALLVAASLLVAACVGDTGAADVAVTRFAYVYAPSAHPDEPIQPLPVGYEANADLVRLGDQLFHDKGLSGDGTVACASCHSVPDGGDDGLGRSTGIRGQKGGINAPTVLNSGLNMAQFWNGRAETLEEQAKGPVEHPKEMGGSWDAVVARVAADPGYAGAFDALFPDGVTADNIRAAIATFERTLITPDSPFDRWLRGDDGALSERQLAGYQLFKAAGCVTCHQGRNVGGNMYQVFGVMGDYFEDRGGEEEADLGRVAVTHDEGDRHVFRVPSLRNVALTAPYFHDASASSLEDVVRVMATYQLGRMLDDEETALIVEFLKSLTGTIPATGGGAR
ncbi:MAG: cytochrome-c peroxidase [Myxococcales bacterium]|nr:cytochrome-c peroxidase [Myxococcales bacterium]